MLLSTINYTTTAGATRLADGFRVAEHLRDAHPGLLNYTIRLDYTTMLYAYTILHYPTLSLSLTPLPPHPEAYAFFSSVPLPFSHRAGGSHVRQLVGSGANQTRALSLKHGHFPTNHGHSPIDLGALQSNTALSNQSNTATFRQTRALPNQTRALSNQTRAPPLPTHRCARAHPSSPSTAPRAECPRFVTTRRIATSSTLSPPTM